MEGEGRLTRTTARRPQGSSCPPKRARAAGARESVHSRRYAPRRAAAEKRGRKGRVEVVSLPCTVVIRGPPLGAAFLDKGAKEGED